MKSLNNKKTLINISMVADILRNLPIKVKFVLIILIITFSSSVAISYILYKNEVRLIEESLVENTISDARLISQYCALPLEFNLPQGAYDVLKKISAKPFIKNIIVFDQRDSVFSAFSSVPLEKRVTPSIFADKNYFYEGNYLHVLEPIVLYGQDYGHIYLRAYIGIEELRSDQIKIMMLMLAITSLFAYLLTIYFQRFLIKPILKLADTSESIAQTKNYSVVIKAESRDEIGRLIEAYNSMLRAIQTSEAKRDDAYRSLTESEKLYRTLFTRSTDAIFMVERITGRIFDANKSAEELTGLSRDVLVTMRSGMLTVEGSVDRLTRIEQVEESLDFGEVIFVRPNGELRVTVMNGVIINRNYFYGIAHDITNRKLVELQLTKMSLVIEQSPLSIVITNSQGIIEYVNPFFSKLTGYSFSEAVGRKTSILNSGYHDSAFYKDLWENITAGNIWSGEIYNRKKSGEKYWESIVITPIRNSSGGIENFVAIKEDISGKKALLEELIESKNKAEEMSRLKSNFLANMSHELRTPMNGILGFSEMLQESTSEPKLIRMAATIHRSATRLLETLNLILDLSRIESGKFEVQYMPVNLHHVLTNTLALYQQACINKNLKLIYTNECKEIMIFGDDRALHSIFNNLVNNAIKFTPSGSINISASLASCDGETCVAVEVADTGVGIPAESIDVIFEEFRQASEGRSRAFEGTGLGLTLTKKFVLSLQGDIKVKSELNHGSVFTVTLPIYKKIESRPEPEPAIMVKSSSPESLPSGQPSAAAYADHPAPDASAGSNTKHILLVEDDDVNISYINDILGSIYNISSVSSGEQAFELVEKKQYDLILMDINLGRGWDGVETTRRIRQLPQFNGAPVIALTAFAMVGDREEFLEKGMTDYLSKPFSRQELIAKLQFYLPKSS